MSRAITPRQQALRQRHNWLTQDDEPSKHWSRVSRFRDFAHQNYRKTTNLGLNFVPAPNGVRCAGCGGRYFAVGPFAKRRSQTHFPGLKRPSLRSCLYRTKRTCITDLMDRGDRCVTTPAALKSLRALSRNHRIRR